MPHKDPDIRRAYARSWRARHLEQERERRRSYRGTCSDCGSEISAGNGKAKDPTKCFRCANPFAPCGTRSAYSRGCHCDACRKAQADYQRQWNFKRRQAA